MDDPRDPFTNYGDITDQYDIATGHDKPAPTADDGVRVQDGGYGEWKQDGEDMYWNEWSTFTMEVLSEIETVNGTIELDIRVTPRDGTPYEVTVSPTVFNDVRAFQNAVCIELSTAWKGGRAELTTVRQYLSNQNAPRKEGTDHLGLHDDVWVTPTRNLSATGWLDETTIEYVEKGNTIERAWSCPDEYDQDDVARMLELLPRTRDTERMLPLLGWFYASSFRPLIMEWAGQFNLMSVTGETGSGKTATIETLWEMFGMDSGPMSVTDTKFTLQTSLGSTNSIPIWYDEYKPSDISSYKIDTFLNEARKATRGGVSQRGNADKTTDEYRLEAPLVVSGEERIQGSAEERRGIFTSFKKASTETGSQTAQAFAELTGGSARVDGSIRQYDGHDLGQHALAWIQWVLAQDEARLHDEWRRAGKTVDTLIAGHGVDEMEDLVRQGLQTIQFGCDRYREFADSVGADVSFDTADVAGGISYVALDSIGGANRKSHLDTLFIVAARAAHAGYLDEDQHYVVTVSGEVRINLSRSIDPIRRYANDYAIPQDLLGSKSDYNRRIEEVIDDHPYITCQSQNTPPVNRCVGIDIDATEAALPDFEGGMFDSNTSTSNGNWSTESF